MPITRDRGSTRQSMRRIIHKQGYLKKLPNAAKFGSRIKKAERRWFVFGVMNGNDPYLEYFATEEAMVQNMPINIVFLETCLGVVREHNRHRYANAFTLVLRERYLTLVAASRDDMSTWCRTFEVQLTMLGILHLNLRGENDYVDIPNVTKPNRRRRAPSNASVSENAANNDESQTDTVMLRRPRNRTNSNLSADSHRATVIGLGQAEEGDNEDTYETLWEIQDDQSLYAVPNRQGARNTVAQELFMSRAQNGAVSRQSRPLPVVPTQNGDTDTRIQENNVNTAIEIATAKRLFNPSSPEQAAYANVGQDLRSDTADANNEIKIQNTQTNNQMNDAPENSTDLNQNENKIYENTVEPRANEPVFNPLQENQLNTPVANTQTSTHSTNTYANQNSILSSTREATSTTTQALPRDQNSPRDQNGSAQEDLGATAAVSPIPGYTAYSPVSPNTPHPNVFPPSNQSSITIVTDEANTRTTNEITPDGSHLSPEACANTRTTNEITRDDSHLSPEACANSSSSFIAPEVNLDLTPPLSPMGSKAQIAMAAPSVEVAGWTIAPPVGGDAPPPYMPKGVLEKGANTSLRQTQVEELQKQQKHFGGLKIVLKKADCHQNIAFIECFDCVWIAGWNQTVRPYLSNALHIGDTLISVNGQVIDSTKLAYKLIKQCKDTDKISLVIKRIPAGKIYLFKRDRDSQSLGLQREGGTAEIKGVDLNSLAVRRGLFAVMPTVHTEAMCHPYITEINNRPLNLFYQQNEIERMLSAVGREVSLVVHPVNLIHEFKKRLKAMRGYKDYLLE